VNYQVLDRSFPTNVRSFDASVLGEEALVEKSETASPSQFRRKLELDADSMKPDRAAPATAGVSAT
jgi:hypothetical protein